jgi:hypothetical protein
MYLPFFVFLTFTQIHKSDYQWFRQVEGTLNGILGVCVNVLFVFRLCKNVVDKKPCKNLASPGARRATIDIQVGVIELPDMR